MVKMSPFVVAVAVLVIVSHANADVSHLRASNGYQYANLGLTSNLELHTPDSPASTQYLATYSDGGNFPNSYSPPPSGSPFASAAPLPVSFPSQRLSVPLQSPVYASQKQQVQPTYQQYQQSRSYQPQAYQTQAYQSSTQQPTYQIPPAYQPQTQAAPTYNAYARTQTQTQTQSVQSQEPIITKHFYVHAAPEDPEEKTGPRFVQVGRARKNYKIIFIKPPTYDLSSQIIPVVPPTEEKTIVYVLSKKPTLDQNIQLPDPAPTEPSKPDVFFIKYKTQQEAEQAQQSIQAAYNQANLVSADSADQISSKFASASSSGSSAFGGQDSTNYQQTSQ